MSAVWPNTIQPRMDEKRRGDKRLTSRAGTPACFDCHFHSVIDSCSSAFVPPGTHENSPPFQRWDCVRPESESPDRDERCPRQQRRSQTNFSALCLTCALGIPSWNRRMSAVPGGTNRKCGRYRRVSSDQSLPCGHHFRPPIKPQRPFL